MSATPLRFHLSLNVADLKKSIEFFRVLLGCEPAKVRPDYAKFEPDEPPLVLSLEPTARPVGGPLNHAGFRFPDAVSLVAAQERLERAGIRTQREEGVECCYAKQTKFWVLDPDRTLWEMYILEGDIEHRGAGQKQEVVIPPSPAVADEPLAVWEHRMTDPLPARLPLADASVDEVRFRGTFNMPLDVATQAGLLREAWRALKPGGRLFLHTLVGESAVTGPRLPGPAARVEYVPQESALTEVVEAAGFRGLYQAKFDAAPCFRADGVSMRELQLEARKPAAGAETLTVIYRGPFREAIDDAGHVYPRGRRVTVPAADAAALRHAALAGQFTFLTAGGAVGSSCAH